MQMRSASVSEQQSTGFCIVGFVLPIGFECD